jgi:AraC family transcriptional regulator
MRRAVGGTLLSSGDAYSGLAASYLALEAGALEIAESATYRIAVHVGRPHRLWDRRDGAACVGPHARGDVVLTTVGETRAIRWDRSSSFLALQLDPALVRDLAASAGADPDRVDIGGAFSHRDPRIESLAFALFRELVAGMPSGRLFGEEIAGSLAAHLLERHGRGRAANAIGLARGGLSKPRLKRVVAHMHDAMSERIALTDLARLAELSPFHFARQFRRATGLAPHAYLLRVRVEEATRAILQGAEPADAAARVGFSSQGHLTQHMRRALGITPGRLAAAARGRRSSFATRQQTGVWGPPRRGGDL